MEFSPQQAAAVDKVGTWLNDTANTQQTFRLFGYAGTGKTTLAKYLAEGQKTVFATYTGKAASVLRSKGLPNACTIHRLIYQLVPPNTEKMRQVKDELAKATKPEEISELKKKMQELNKPRFVLKEDALKDIDLVVIDECSMVGEDIGNDLLSFGKKILVLGDPAQLPPVSGAGFFTDHEPDVLLTEIHRQAAGNPIITMATLVRQGGRLRFGKYGSSECVSRHHLDKDHFKLFEQTIVGLNRTRKSLNTMFRDLYGFYGASVPAAGDKLICLKNNHEVGILNGTQWACRRAEDNGSYVEIDIVPWEEQDLEDDEDYLELTCHPFDVDLTDMPWYERRRYDEFDWGYAITCHKAQGSQWKSVLIVNEGFVFKKDANRWLYTAITRAEDKVLVAI